ncbi:MAG: HAMP domain-containing sensor histidine kinase [Planctomycetota bacterium]|nr:HAMP domain-containing sensor histidine kinase [Planctomycetota bacterium]
MTDGDGAQIPALAHEFRTPLTAILGYLDQLIDELPDRVDALQRLHVMRDNSEHLLALVNRLVDSSPRLRDGGFEPFSAVRAVAEALHPSARAKDLELAITAHAPLPARIAVEALRVRQILFNLLGNAIAYTQRGGIRIELSQRDDNWCCEVIDTGPGIAKELRDHVFDAFASSGLGSGLGLYVSQRLASALGGALTLSASDHSGSRFCLTLPLTLASETVTDDKDPLITALQRPLRRQRDHAQQGKRVLIAEPSGDQGLLLSSICKHLRCDTTLVNTCPDARDLVLARDRVGPHFDLVILACERQLTGARRFVDELRANNYAGKLIVSTTDVNEPIPVRCDAVIQRHGEPAQIRDTILRTLVTSAPAD